MTDEAWILEVQMALGRIAKLVRVGDSGERLTSEVNDLKRLTFHWATWTNSDGEGKLTALHWAEEEGFLLELDDESTR